MTEKDTFICFMNEMHKWESYATNIGLVNNLDEHREIVRNIFNKYCTPKDRKRGKPNILSASSISSYDLSTQPIYNIEYKTKKTIIYTKQKNKAENNFRYTLILKNDKWLIDKKEISYNNGESWESSIL